MGSLMTRQERRGFQPPCTLEPLRERENNPDTWVLPQVSEVRASGMWDPDTVFTQGFSGDSVCWEPKVWEDSEEDNLRRPATMTKEKDRRGSVETRQREASQQWGSSAEAGPVRTWKYPQGPAPRGSRWPRRVVSVDTVARSHLKGHQGILEGRQDTPPHRKSGGEGAVGTQEMLQRDLSWKKLFL